MADIDNSDGESLKGKTKALKSKKFNDNRKIPLVKSHRKKEYFFFMLTG